MKIKTIKVENVKSVSNQELNLNGCSVVVIGANGSGKSTILRSLFDRILGEKPEIIVKKGESKGVYELELMDGARIVWSSTEKTEKLEYITADGIPVKSGVIGILQDKYFNGQKKQFSIDLFLKMSPAEQRKELLRILKIDLSIIENEYKEAFDSRASIKKDLNNLIANKKTAPEKVERLDVYSIISEIEALKKKRDNENESIAKENEKLRTEWNEKCKTTIQEAEIFNFEQKQKADQIETYYEKLSSIESVIDSYGIFRPFFNFAEAKNMINELPKPEPKKEVVIPEEPTYRDLVSYESEIDALQLKRESAALQNSKADQYEKELSEYTAWVEKGKQTREKLNNLEEKIKSIINQKDDLVRSANMPEGFSFEDDKLLYNGFPLDRNQQASSQIYIAGLKLASLVVGDLRAIHFDASYLDRKNLEAVEQYASTMDLQLLIERPDFEGGEINYCLIGSF